MKEIGGKLVYDTSEFEKAVKDVIGYFEQMQKSEEEWTEEAQKNLETLLGALNGHTDALKEHATEIDRSRKKQEQANAVMKNAARELSIFGVSVGDVEDKLSKWKQQQAAVNVLLGKTNKLLKITKVALAATGIGAIVVVLGSVIGFLTQTQNGIDKVNIAMGRITGPINVITKQFFALGEAILSGKNAGEAFIKFFSGRFIQEMKAASIATAALRETQIKLRKSLRDLDVQTARSRSNIEKLKLTSEDTTKSFEERIDAAKKANEEEQKLLKSREGQLSLMVGLLKLQNALSADPKDETRLREIANAEIDLANVREESYAKQNELGRTVNALLKEQDDLILGFQDRIKDVEGGVIEILKNIDKEKRGLIGKEVIEISEAISELEKQKIIGIEAILNVSKELGRSDEFTQSRIDAFSREFEILEEILQNKLKKLGLNFSSSGAYGDLASAFESGGKNLGGKLILGIDQSLADINKIFNSEQFEAFKSVFSGVADAMTSGIDLQIAKLDELIEKQDEKVSALEEQLNNEKEFQDAGLATRLESLQTEIDSETAKREEAIKKREELEKKSQRIQLIQDSLSQASSLTTAASQIFKALSGIPFVGIPLAIAAVATMFGAFAKAKVDALKITKLRTGTQKGPIGQYMHGGHGGDEDHYAVIDERTGEDTGVRIGANEGIMRPEVESEHGQLLHDMNRNPGKYAGRNLYGELIKSVDQGGRAFDPSEFGEMPDKEVVLRDARIATYERQSIILNQGLNQEQLEDALENVLYNHRQENWHHENQKPEVTYHTEKPSVKIVSKNGGKSREIVLMDS